MCRKEEITKLLACLRISKWFVSKAGKQGVCGGPLGFNSGHVDKDLGGQAEVIRFYSASTNDVMRSWKPTENTVLKGYL